MAGWKSSLKEKDKITWEGQIHANSFVGDISGCSGDISKMSGYKDISKNNHSANVFDGVDDYVEVPHSSAQLGANLSNGFTISAWINPRSLGEASVGRIIDKNSGTNSFVFNVRTTNSVAFVINGGTQRQAGADAITLGIWQHVLVTISSGQLVNFYIDGVATGTADQDLVQTIATITSTEPILIGNRAATTATFDGSIAQVKMWNRVLTTEEITNDYSGITPANPIHYFKLGGDYRDYGSVGVTATNSGSVVEEVFDNNVNCSLATITTDSTASGASVVRNILIGAEETPPAAASVTQGTLYVQYTA